MNILRQFILFKKILKKIKAIKKVLKSNKELEQETKMLIDNIKLNIELLISKFPELRFIYLEIMEILNDN